MSNLVLISSRKSIVKKAQSFFEWLRFRFHNCFWVDEKDGPITKGDGYWDKNGDWIAFEKTLTIGHYYIQKCAVEGCGKRRRTDLR